jgi:flagellin
MRIQHNIMAMNAYRNYNTNTSALSGNLEKLSSGYKINRAGDDAAGLAISEKMRAQISGLEQASSNVKDGISLVKTGEGAMQEVQDMLNRMVTLATQSANGTYDDETDRANLQKEVDALKSEINRIADSSNFNGINLLDGSLDNSVKTSGDTDLFVSKTLTVEADGQIGNTPQAGVFELDLSKFSGKASGKSATLTVFGKTVKLTTTKGDTVTGEEFATALAKSFGGTSGTAAFTTEGVNLTATANGSVVTFTMDKAPTEAWAESADVTIGGIEDSSSADGQGNQAYPAQVTVIKEPVDSSAGREYAQASIDLSKLSIVDGSALTIGDTSYVFAVGSDSNNKDTLNKIDLTDITADDVANKLDLVADRITTAAQDNKNFKVTAQTPVDGTGDMKIYLTEKDGGVDTDNYKLEGKDNATTGQDKDGDWTGLVKFGKVDSANMGKALSLQIGDTAKSYNQLKVTVDDIHTSNLGIDDIDISNQENAATAIDKIKAAINQVSSTRGDLGAVQNRLEHTANNLSVMTENIQDAESTIRDTDIAEEMMSYTKNSILVQSAQAMLAQANTVPQGVLQLLQ